ncbi:MAG: glycosyltransferase family 2 protein [candidate division Zixibacteria bacterium]|nr:glycosyltransferase family 2 protein [candidate division Zixibacteria bacterium]
MRLSAILITKNEEANLERCLHSVEWVDEIIVVDSDSIDRTIEIAKKFGAKIFNPEWKGFGPAKQYALDQATGDWVLSIDADEEVSFTLKNEIIQLLEGEPELCGYEIPRKTQFLGQWILHSGWYPDYVLRLFNKGEGCFTEALVHEKVEVKGKVGKLNNQLLHYSYPTIEDYTRKLDIYSSLGAEELYKKGKNISTLKAALKPPCAFLRKYIFQKGWKDGWEGFLIAYLTSTGTLLKYAKLRLKYRDAEKKKY